MKTILALALTLIVAQAAPGMDTSWNRHPIRYVNGVRHDLRPVFAWYEASSTIGYQRTMILRSGQHAASRLAVLDAKERLLASQSKWASRYFVRVIGKIGTLTPAMVNFGTVDAVDVLVRNVPKDAPPFIAAIPVGWVRDGERIVMLYDYGTPGK